MGRGLIVGALLTSVLVACSGGSSGTSNEPTGSGSGSASSAQAFVQQYCDLFAPCCAKVSKTYDQGKCTAFLGAFTSSATFDPAKGDGCLAAARAKQSDPNFCDSGAGEGACDGVFESAGGRGAKPLGTQCEDDDECAASPEGTTRCATHFANNATTKTCQVQVHGKEGDEPCVGYKDGSTTVTSSSGNDEGPPPNRVVICWTADNLFCNRTTKKCERSQGVGGSCDPNSTFACDKSGFCDSATKKCVARLAQDATCQPFNDKQCADKLFCDDTTKKCTPSTPTGSPCEKNDQCEKGSCTNGKCSSSFGTSFTTAILCQ